MPSLADLQFQQGITDNLQKHADEAQKQDMLKAAAGQAMDLYLKGDVNGAMAVMGKANPDLAAKVLEPLATTLNPQVQGAVKGAQTKADLEAETPFGNTERQRLDAELASKERIAAAEKARKPSVAESAMDRAYAKAYDELVFRGGLSRLNSNVKTIETAIQGLEKTDAASGGLVGVTPDWARSMIPGLREGVALQDALQGVALESLKDMVGATNISDADREAVFARIYNKKLSEDQNIEKAKRFLGQIKMAGKAQIEAARYFEENGTMKGYKGQIITSVNDVLNMNPDEPKNSSSSKKSSSTPAIDPDAAKQELKRRGLLK